MNNPATAPFVWQGRTDSEEVGDSRRWHHVVRPFDVASQDGVALIGFAVDEGVRRNGGRPGAAEGPRALRGALANPLPWAIALGAVFSVTGLKLPGPADTVVKLLGDAATPVALFAIGAVLWRAGQHVHTRTAPIDYVPIALVKNLVHPLLVLALAAAAHAAGLPLTPFQVMVMVLTAALPSASNVSLLAERYQADNGRVARIIMTSTVLAFVSFTALAWLFGVRPGG